MKVVNFKAEPDDIDRWKKQAWEARITFGEWARRRLNAPEVVVAPSLARLTSTTGRCDHRIPPGTWCKRCEKIKK